MLFLPRKTDSQKTSKHNHFNKSERVVTEFFSYSYIPNINCFQIGKNNISGKSLVNCLQFRLNPKFSPKYENKFYPIVEK